MLQISQEGKTMKSFYKNANITPQAIFGISAIVMGAVSLYLTDHYYSTLFPTTLQGSALCDISSFWNCDHTLNSPLSSIMGIPISLFGLLFSAFLFIGWFIPKESIEGTNHILLRINLVGCILLFLYSIAGLGGLCPGCTIYYIFSAINAYIFFHHSDIKKFDGKVFGAYAIMGLIVSGLAWAHLEHKKSANDQIAKALIPQFEKLTNVGDPEPSAPFYYVKATENFKDSPIRITKFSDYQCPGCRVMAKVLEKVAHKFRGSVSIQYIFTPLDINCNTNMKAPLHPSACMASYFASCSPDKFNLVTEMLFENQDLINDNWIQDMAANYNTVECIKSDGPQKIVQEHLEIGNKFNVSGTPTLIINGKKITRMLPANQLFILLEHLKSGK